MEEIVKESFRGNGELNVYSKAHSTQRLETFLFGTAFKYINHQPFPWTNTHEIEWKRVVFGAFDLDVAGGEWDEENNKDKRIL